MKTILTRKKNTNLHQIYTAPALRRRKLEAGKTIKHEKMNNIKVVDMSVNEHRRVWVVRRVKKN